MTDETRKVIGSAKRSFGFSMGILLIGFVSIMLVLVYRVTRDEGSPVDQYVLEQIVVPESVTITSITTNEGIVAVTYQQDGNTLLRLLDGASGEVLADIPVRAENGT